MSISNSSGNDQRLRWRFSGCVAAAMAVNGMMASAAATQAPPAGIEAVLQRVATVAGAPGSRQAAEKLWGVPLDAPVVVHDRASGTNWQRNSVTGATVPVALRKDQPPANTCTLINDVPSVLLLLPLPADPDGLATLLWHEQWHCVQAALGLPAAEGDTAHLDSEAGRTALRLEMRALAQAVAEADDRQARQHAAAALGFRALRSGSPPSSKRALAEEANVERNEGLAEYTGRVVAAAASGANAAPAVVEALAKADASQSFVRSAAYATGPAYGMLLDRWLPSWRSGLSTTSDLPGLLAETLDAPLDATDIALVGDTYGMNAVRTEERERAKARERRSAEYRQRFLGNDAVRLSLRTPSVSFDPRALFPLDDAGTVYTPLTVRDEWGELTAESGALLSKDWALLSVSGDPVEGEASRWTGPGWTLELSEGWRLGRDAEGWRLQTLP
ncbi:MAG: hypothetical protein ABWY09_02190 [Stenotrophomonas maltophilia]